MSQIDREIAREEMRLRQLQRELRQEKVREQFHPLGNDALVMEAFDAADSVIGSLDVGREFRDPGPAHSVDPMTEVPVEREHGLFDGL